MAKKIENLYTHDLKKAFHHFLLHEPTQYSVTEKNAKWQTFYNRLKTYCSVVDVIEDVPPKSSSL